MPSITDKLKSYYNRGKKAAEAYFTPDVDKARAGFDYAKSAKERQESAAAAKRLAETSKTQRVSGRKKSRANELARVHGRSDEEKIQSQAVAARNRRVARDTALTALPGGAASGALAKAGLAAKGAKAVATAGKTALKLGSQTGKSLAKKAATGVAKYAKGQVKRAQKAGAKKIANKVAALALKKGKAKAKMKAQGFANKKVQEHKV